MKPHRLVLFAAPFLRKEGVCLKPFPLPLPHFFTSFLRFFLSSSRFLAACGRSEAPGPAILRQERRFGRYKTSKSGSFHQRPLEVAKMIRRGCWPRPFLLPSLHLSPSLTSSPHPRLMLCLLLLRYKTEQGRKAAGKVVSLGRGGYQSAGCGQVMI